MSLLVQDRAVISPDNGDVHSKRQTEPRFRAKVAKGPQSVDVETQTKCIYGVSVGSHKLIEQIAAGFAWSRRYFADTAILLGDGLRRISVQIIGGLDERRAATQAGREGALLLKDLSQVCDLYQVPILRSSNLMQKQEFKLAIRRLIHCHEQNKAFRDSINLDATDFVQRCKRQNRLAVSETAALRLSTAYLLEEIAVYKVLADEGWLLDVYLGRELRTLAKIASGEITDIAASLARRTNIALLPR